MTHGTELVRTYMEALFSGPGGYARARALLADDLDYHDPLMSVSSADDLVGQLQSLGEVDSEASQILHVLGDDDVVAALSVFRLPNGRTVDYAQWFWLDAGRIRKVRVIYDPRAFFEEGSSG